MSENDFDQLAQEISKQKELMDKLEAENRELRQQIADLNSGGGMFVEICGTRFALRGDLSSLAQAALASSAPASTSTVATSTPAATLPRTQQMVDAPTEAIIPIASQSLDQSARKHVSELNPDPNKKSNSGESTFLEEIMIDEFTTALGSSNAVGQDPTEKKHTQQQRKPQKPTNEEQKATLRRELTGSFLLEY